MKKILSGSILVFALGVSGVMGNLLTNPGFESQGATSQDATNWVHWGGSRESWQANDGSWSATYHAYESSAGWFQDSPPGSVTEGEEYVGGAWFYNDLNASWGYTNAFCQIKIEWYDASTNAVGTPVSMNFTAPGEIWTYYAVTGMAPSGVSFGRVVGYASDSGIAQGSSGAGNLFMDTVSLNEVIPEPTTAMIMSIGLVGLHAVRRIRSRKQ